MTDIPPPPADDPAARARTVADAETAIRDGLIYEHRRFTDDDLWMVLGELERLNAVCADMNRIRNENKRLAEEMDKFSGGWEARVSSRARLRAERDAAVASVAAVRALADDLDRDVQAAAGLWSAAVSRAPSRIRAVLDGPAVAPGGSGAVSTRTPDPRDFDLCRIPEPPADEGSARVSIGPAEAAEPTWLAAEGEALFRAQVAEAGAPEPDDYDGDELVLVRMPGRMSGRPTVGHSRLTLTTLLEYLRAGDSPELVLNAYPSVTREQMRVVAALALDLAEHDEMEGRAGSVTTTPAEPDPMLTTAAVEPLSQALIDAYRRNDLIPAGFVVEALVQAVLNANWRPAR